MTIETPATSGSASASAAAPARQHHDAGITDIRGMWEMFRRHAWATARYLTETEVHTYAFSVAANAILSFFPAVVLMLTLTRRVFHSDTMYDVILQMLRDYLPANQEFIIK